MAADGDRPETMSGFTYPAAAATRSCPHTRHLLAFCARLHGDIGLSTDAEAMEGMAGLGGMGSVKLAGLIVGGRAVGGGGALWLDRPLPPELRNRPAAQSSTAAAPPSAPQAAVGPPPDARWAAPSPPGQPPTGVMTGLPGPRPDTRIDIVRVDPDGATLVAGRSARAAPCPSSSTVTRWRRSPPTTGVVSSACWTFRPPPSRASFGLAGMQGRVPAP